MILDARICAGQGISTVHGDVSTSGPSSVIATVCSEWAEVEPSRVTTVHPSAKVFVSALLFYLGSTAMAVPGDSFSRFPGGPWLGPTALRGASGRRRHPRTRRSRIRPAPPPARPHSRHRRPASGPALLDRRAEGSLGHLQQTLHLRVDLSNGERPGGIGMEPLVQHSEVDDVPLIEGGRTGDAVDDDVVRRGTDRAGETSIPLEGSLGTGSDEDLLEASRSRSIVVTRASPTRQLFECAAEDLPSPASWWRVPPAISCRSPGRPPIEQRRSCRTPRRGPQAIDLSEVPRFLKYSFIGSVCSW